MIKKTKSKPEPLEEEQESLFKPLAEWLESKGYYSLITHGKKEVGVWIGDLFPSKTYIEPDVVGVRSSWLDTICIEAESKVESENLFEILGKCRLWKLITSNVYLAYPKQAGFKTSGFEKLNIGLLEVSNNHVKEVFTPRSDGGWDSSKSQEFFNQVWNVIRSQPRKSAVQLTDINAYKYEKKWSVTVRFRNTGSDELTLTRLLINGKAPKEIPEVNLTSKFPTKENPLLVGPFREDYISMEISESESFKGNSQVEFCLEAEGKGKDIRKIKLPQL
jgi:hypothetical protein